MQGQGFLLLLPPDDFGRSQYEFAESLDILVLIARALAAPKARVIIEDWILNSG